MSRLATDRAGTLWTLTLSGILGFWLGITAFPNWHVAVETAQVVARLVTYPPDNPFYIYHVRLWTVLHEVLAVLLRAGISEIAASKLMSGALGMVSLQALSMVIYAFGGGAIYATSATFVIFLAHAAEFGGRYPISLMGTTHSYGAFGLSSLVLTIALLGAGRYRMGGLLLGAVPAIHPSLGIWLFVILTVAVATDFKHLRTVLRPALPWFIAGCAFTALSLIVHLALAPDVSVADNAEADRYLTTLVSVWDGHRRPAHLHNSAVYLNGAGIVLGLTWLLFFKDRLPAASQLLLRFAAVSGAIAVGFIFVSWAPPEWVPDVLNILMPLRLLNIVSIMFAALLFGLLGVYRGTLLGEIAILVLLVALLLSDYSRYWGSMPGALLGILEGKEFNVRAVMIAAAVAIALLPMAYKRFNGGAATTTVRVLAASRTLIIAGVFVSVAAALPPPEARAVLWHDRTNDPVYAAAASGEGLLLTGNALHLIQLKTRRPVLIDGGGLNGLAYSREAGPAMGRILQDVYGIDWFNPPEEARVTGAIPAEHNRQVWQAYSPAKWQEIRRQYNVTQVLTARDWQLDLPLVAETPDLRLYEIRPSTR